MTHYVRQPLFVYTSRNRSQLARAVIVQNALYHPTGQRLSVGRYQKTPLVLPVLNVTQLNKHGRWGAVFNYIKRVASADFTRIGSAGLVTLVIGFETLMDVFGQSFSYGVVVVVVKENVDGLALAAAIDMNGNKALVTIFMTGVEPVYC